MKKIIFIFTLFLLLPQLLLFADNKCVLNIQISNQSFERPNEKIALYLGGKLLFEDILPVHDLHYVKSFDMKVDANERHWIRAIAKDSHIESGLTLDLKKDQYVYITYWYDKAENIAGFQFNVNDEYIGID